MTNKNIVVDSYNPNWPSMFEAEALKIKEALGSHCLAVHHIGSTAVPGLAAKPKIDMIAVVDDPDKTIELLEKIGLQYRGEYNIPMHYGFSKRGLVEINLHVYQDGHPEIELNLAFRDYLRHHSDARDEYANLKRSLLNDSSSSEKKNSMFSSYNLGKDAFIRKVLKAAGFNRIRIVRCVHYIELEKAKKLRQKYFFDPQGIDDPYTWTFDHQDHAHIVLYQGVDIIGYAHIEFCPNKKAALRILVIDEPYQHHGFGPQFLQLCEQWLKKLDVQLILDSAMRL